MLAILGSSGEEIAYLKEQLDVNEEHIHAGISFHSGTIDQASIVVAEAGTGRVRVAAATQIVLDRFDADEVVLVGSAQPIVPFLQQGDLVIGERLWQFDATHIASIDEETDVLDDDSTIAADPGLVRRLDSAYKGLFSHQSDRPQLISGMIVSDDHRRFGKKMIGTLHRRFGAVAVDYTGAAAAEVCCMNDVSFVVVRTITEMPSNVRQENTGPGPRPRPECAGALIREILSSKSPVSVV
jgi:adenosylhomocysteine nucleosidase